MKNIFEIIRGGLLSLTLEAGKLTYSLTGGLLPRKFFLRQVSHKKEAGSVSVIKESSEETFIEKKGEGDFRILIATDMHIGDDREKRNKTLSMLMKNIGDIKPDLVIFTGDIILSRFQQLESLEFARLMEETGVYWAIIFGNHEAAEEKGFFKHFLVENLSKYPHCLTKPGPDSLFGYGNFMINIVKNGALLKNLVFFDSGRNIRDEYRKEYKLPEKLQGYDFIKENQIEWYERKADELKEKYGAVKSLIFMHIPLPEYKEVMELQNENEIPSGKETGRAEVIWGSIHEAVSCSPYNSGLFERAVKKGAEGFFAGHDHMNDFTAVYKGAYLVYCQFSGYDEYSYGTEYKLPEKEWLQGVTEVRIGNNGEIKTERHLNSRYL